MHCLGYQQVISFIFWSLYFHCFFSKAVYSVLVLILEYQNTSLQSTVLCLHCCFMMRKYRTLQTILHTKWLLSTKDASFISTKRAVTYVLASLQIYTMYTTHGLTIKYCTTSYFVPGLEKIEYDCDLYISLLVSDVFMATTLSWKQKKPEVKYCVLSLFWCIDGNSAEARCYSTFIVKK